jgi:hypothetical protein
MVQDIPGCDVGCFSNKTARVTTVSRLNAMGVPAEIGMKLTGHNSREGYMRYNTDEDGIEMRALQNIASAVSGTGGDISWHQALNYERQRFYESQNKQPQSILPSPSVSSSICDVRDGSEIVDAQDRAMIAQLVPAPDVNCKRMIEEDDWWSNSDVQQEIEALITSKKQTVEISRVNNISNVSNVFHGNISNCTIQLSIPDVASASALFNSLKNQ